MVATQGGRLLLSADGRQWSPPRVEVNALFTTVTAGNGRLVAAGNAWDSNLAAVATSTDGESWNTVYPKPAAGTDATGTRRLFSATYGNGIYVIAGKYTQGEQFYPLFLTSTDGVSWQEIVLQQQPTKERRPVPGG